MKRTRITSALLAVLLAAGCISACGKKEEEKKESNTQAPVNDEYTVDGVKLELPEIDGGG